MFVYAVLNESDVAERYVMYSQELIKVPNNYIKIKKEEFENIQYRKYENGQWSEEKYVPPEPTPQPTVEEEILYENKYQTLLLEMGML